MQRSSVGGATMNVAIKIVLVILPGTGEQGYIHRRNTLALPLAEKGIACMVSRLVRFVFYIPLGM